MAFFSVAEAAEALEAADVLRGVEWLPLGRRFGVGFTSSVGIVGSFPLGSGGFLSRCSYFLAYFSANVMVVPRWGSSGELWRAVADAGWFFAGFSSVEKETLSKSHLNTYPFFFIFPCFTLFHSVSHVMFHVKHSPIFPTFFRKFPFFARPYSRLYLHTYIIIYGRPAIQEFSQKYFFLYSFHTFPYFFQPVFVK